MSAKVSDLREEVRAALESLARLAALRSDLTVRIGRPGTGWCISMTSGRISVDERDLLGRSPEFLAAITLHECAHSTLTRLHHIAPEQIHDNPVEFCLINAIEDGRIETWLADWLPGCSAWLTSTHGTLVTELHRRYPDAFGKNPAMDFCMGLLLIRHGMASPAPLHPAATEALAETADHIEAYFDSFPRFDLLESCSAHVAKEYDASPLAACFAAHDGPMRPGTMEMSVRLAQYRAWRILHDKVRPVYLRLVSMDPDGRKALRLHQFLQRLRLNRDPQPSNGEEREAMRNIREIQDRLRKSFGKRRRAGRRLGTDPVHGSGESYARERSRQAAVINRLGDALLRLRRTHGRLKWSAGHAHGSEPDLRVAMEFAATGRNHDRMWRRRNLPHRIAPAIVLVVDRSSSMKGSRALATFAASVIVAEVCRRAGLPLAVITYNTQASTLVGFNEGGSSKVEGKIEAILQTSGGTQIVPALEAADKVIAASPHREHLVIVIADGEFDDDERLAFDSVISRWKTTSTRTAGLGLGPQTNNIAAWFPGARANLQPADLCDELTRVVSSFLAELYHVPAAA